MLGPSFSRYLPGKYRASCLASNPDARSDARLMILATNTRHIVPGNFFRTYEYQWSVGRRYGLLSIRFHVLKFDLSFLVHRDLIGLDQSNRFYCRSLCVLYSISVVILQGHFLRGDQYEHQRSNSLTLNHPEIQGRVSHPLKITIINKKL
jgi:hypothetical protein